MNFPLRRCSYSQSIERCGWYTFCQWKDGKCVASDDVKCSLKPEWTLSEMVGIQIGVWVILFLLTLLLLSYPAFVEKFQVWRIWLRHTCFKWCISVCFCCLVYRYCHSREVPNDRGMRLENQQERSSEQRQLIRCDEVHIDMEPS